MKHLSLATLWAACSLIFLGSCKGGIKADLAIPKNAALVVHINSGSLTNKLSWEEIKNTMWYKDLYAEAKDSIAKRLLNNPEASGVDTKSDFAFFIQRRGRGAFSMLQGGIKDETAFTALVKKLSGQEQINKQGEWNMMDAAGTSVIAWNEKKFAFISDVSEIGEMNPMTRQTGEKFSFSTDTLKSFVTEVMSMKGDQSLFDDGRFSDLMKQEGDLHLWLNSGALYADMNRLMSMTKIGGIFENNVSATTINFEEGKIAVRSKAYFGKEMQELMEKHKAREVEAAVLNRLPSQDLVGVIAANVDPEAVKAFVKATGFEGIVNMMMGEQNITLDDVFASTGGQFVVAVTDLQLKTDSALEMSDFDTSMVMTVRTKPDMKVLFAASVNQKPVFEKLLGVAGGQSGKLPFNYKLTNEWFVAGSNTQAMDRFLAGSNTTHSFTEKISGHPVGMYIDLQKLLKGLTTQDTANAQLINENAAVWQDVVSTVGKYEDDYLPSEMIINLTDKNTNSLKQLNRFMERMNELRKKNKVAFKPRKDSDTTAGFDVQATPLPEE